MQKQQQKNIFFSLDSQTEKIMGLRPLDAKIVKSVCLHLGPLGAVRCPSLLSDISLFPSHDASSHLLPRLPDDLGPGREGELCGQRGEVEVLDPVLLPGDAGAGAVDQDAVLVDHVHDGRDLAGVGAVLENGHATDLNELVERLQGEDGRPTLI